MHRRLTLNCLNPIEPAYTILVYGCDTGKHSYDCYTMSSDLSRLKKIVFSERVFQKHN